MMALRSDPDLLVQHGVERHGIPSAVREVPPSVSPRHDERGGDRGERERHQDSLGPGHQPHMARGLEPLKDLERLPSVEAESLHDLLHDGRDRKLEEMVEDVLPHLLPKVGRADQHRIRRHRDYVMGPMNVAARTCGSLEEWIRPSSTKIPAALGNPRRCGRNDIRPTDPAATGRGSPCVPHLDPRPAGRGHPMQRSRAVLVVFVIIALAAATLGLAVRLPSANPTGNPPGPSLVSYNQGIASKYHPPLSSMGIAAVNG